MRKAFASLILGLMMVVIGGQGQLVSAQQNYVDIKREAFQQTVNGKQVDLYTLQNKNGMVAKITNYGGKLVQLLVPDRNGQLGDVALGYESLEQTMKGQASMGCVIGRYANRIGKGKFSLEGVDYQLSINNGVNHLHGGTKGTRFQVFDAVQINEKTLQLTYTFKDGEEGYPGTCLLKATYQLTDNNELVCSYDAVVTDKPTIVNFTNHTFWNLAGAGNGTVLNHEVTLNADYFTPVDDTLITTGEIRSVKGTAMDFTTPHKIGERINGTYEQLKYGPGYDHNFVLNKQEGKNMTFAARVYEPTSGRVMEIYTTEPGIQLYSGNFLDGKKDIGKGGKAYDYRGAFCLETQHFPDSPNKANFPSVVLEPGQWFSSTTIHKFSVK